MLRTRTDTTSLRTAHVSVSGGNCDITVASGVIARHMRDLRITQACYNDWQYCAIQKATHMTNLTVPASLPPITSISAGWVYVMALDHTGQVHIWGDDAWYNTIDSTNPFKPHNLDRDPIRQIASGGRHMLALSTDGTIFAWGKDYEDDTDQHLKCYIYWEDQGNVTAIGASANCTYLIKKTGVLQLRGYIRKNYSDTAIQQDYRDVTHVAASTKHVVLLHNDGHISAFGDATLCVLPTQNTNIRMVSADDTHTLALQADGHVLAWGTNTNGECDVPADLSRVVQVCAGEGVSLALCENGTIRVWGDVASGSYHFPNNITDIIQIAVGNGFAVALRRAGDVIIAKPQ